MNVLDFHRMKKEGRRISMVTCYDYWTARLIESSEIDCVLVGDSVAMVMHGFPSTINATTEMMSLHIAAVARGLKRKFLIGDMPFLSFRKGREAALDCAGELMRAGAHAVKLEGVWGHEDVVEALVQSGIPVMGHIGMTPQSIHQFGGFKVQGKTHEAAENLVRQARRLEELGAFSVVLECVPSHVAETITHELSIPTIGIGAGRSADGQVLVLQDLLGGNADFKPKFVRRFANSDQSIGTALNDYHRSVVEGTFPAKEESYS